MYIFVSICMLNSFVTCVNDSRHRPLVVDIEYILENILTLQHVSIVENKNSNSEDCHVLGIFPWCPFHFKKHCFSCLTDLIWFSLVNDPLQLYISPQHHVSTEIYQFKEPRCSQNALSC